MRSRRASLTTPANWRVRTKLIAILAIPVIAIIVNALIDASSVLTSTRDINRVSHLITVDRAAMDLAQKLELERTYTVAYVAYNAANAGADQDRSRMDFRRQDTDTALKAFNDALKGKKGSFTTQVNEKIDTVGLRMNDLKAKRAVIERFTSADSAMQAYNAFVTPLFDLVGLIPQGNDDRELDNSVQAVQHLALSTDILAQQQAQVEAYMVGAEAKPSPLPYTSDNSRSVLALDAERSNELDQFTASASREQVELYNSDVPQTDPDVTNTEKYSAAVLNSEINRPLEMGKVLAQSQWLQATSAVINKDQKAIGSLLDQIDDRVSELRGAIQRSALFSALFTVVILAAALIITLIVAQSLVRPLFALRTAALDIAERRLPEAVRRLRDSADQVIDDEVESVGIETDEEIGEVAKAFDQVHREAVRLASEQAVLRNNVNAMFVNLSRRSQGLVERQLRLIDDLENREQDPDQLSNLFKLDHLATRMRRNNESLLVLAGTDTARRWTHPVPLNEVVLAAISEVEQYTRIKQTTAAPVSIAGNGVSDVVHLIAELLENATSYSPPATEVIVTSHSLGPGAGAMIEIVDQGIGMPAKELERVNERLASPPVVDVSVSRTMGLFAVGRLAGRHGIRVQLRESPSRGITAVIRLPAKLVTGDGSNNSGSGPAAVRGAAAGGLAAAFGRSGDTSARAGQGAPGLGGGGRPELGPGGPATGPSRQPAGPATGPSRQQPAAFGGMPDARGGQRDYDDERDGRFGAQTGGHAVADAGRFGAPPLAIGPGSSDSGPHTGAMPVQPERRYTEDPTQQFARGGFHQPEADYDDPEYSEYEETTQVSPMTGPMDRNEWTGEFQVPRGGQEQMDLTGPMQRPGMAAANGYGSNGYGAENTGAYNYHEPQTGSHENVFARPPTRPEPIPEQVQRPRWEEHMDPATGGFRRPTVEDTGEFYVGDGEDADTTPIFDSVSAWFQRRSPAEEAAAARRGGDPVVEAAPSGAYGAPRAGAGMQVTSPDNRGNGYSGPQVQRPAEPMRPAARVDSAPMGNGATGGNGYRAATAYADTPSGPPSAAMPLPTRTTANNWESAGDAGWRAAEALRQQSATGETSVTRSGLPMRVPKQHLVPGSAEPASSRKPPERQADAATRAPEAVGGRLASFYQGVRQGRNMGAEMRSARRDGQEDR